jgi:hypothetical protein
MTHPKLDYPDEVLKAKMKKWGINKPEESISLHVTELLKEIFLREIDSKYKLHENKEIESLKKRVDELEKRVGIQRTPTKVDYVYSLFKNELEKHHFGKVIAIDVDSAQVVGIGDSILEAYNEAIKKTKKTQFDFKRVGFKHLHKV